MRVRYGKRNDISSHSEQPSVMRTDLDSLKSLTRRLPCHLRAFLFSFPALRTAGTSFPLLPFTLLLSGTTSFLVTFFTVSFGLEFVPVTFDLLEPITRLR